MADNSRCITFPKSPLGDNSKLNKYLDHCYLLGDPHLGRKFTTGVPVDRKGDREEMVREQFRNEVIGLKPGRKFHVCMGDLFDKYTVDNAWVDFAYKTYREASMHHPEVEFIVLQGNHDGSRDSTKVSSFQLFAELCKPLKNVRVLTNHPYFTKYDGLNFIFVPWVPFKSTAEFLEGEFELHNKLKFTPFCAFGHWDIKSYGQEVCDNIIPFEDHFDFDSCDAVVTGHYHKRDRFLMKQIEVFVTGSMQPYAHGEEEDGLEDPMYITAGISEIQANLEQDINFYKDKVLRVALEADEQPLADINCLAITNKKASQIQAEADLDVETEDFDLHELFHSLMGENNVSEETTKRLWSQL